MGRNKYEKEDSKILKIGIYLFCMMSFVSAIGYSLFPLSSSNYDNSFQNIMHVCVVTALVVILSIISLVLIAIEALKGNNKHKYLGILAIISLSLMCIGAIGSNIVSKDYFGLVERFSTYSAVLFTCVIGFYGFNLKTLKEEVKKYEKK